MLRLIVLASTVPLIASAVFAGANPQPGPRPCIAIGAETFEIAAAPQPAALRIGFTDNPRLATVRVMATDNPALADFAMVDDVDSPEQNGCEATTATRFIAISRRPSAAAPVIYLTRHGPADYRIYVHSTHFTLREAAALIVGARSRRPHLAAAF